MAFYQSFDGQQVRVGSLKFKITKAFFSEAIGLSMVGERWYKKKIVRIGDFTTFLKPQYSMVDWKCGIPTSWLKEDWKQVLKVVQKFITCEGHKYGLEAVAKYDGKEGIFNAQHSPMLAILHVLMQTKTLLFYRVLWFCICWFFWMQHCFED